MPASLSGARSRKRDQWDCPQDRPGHARDRGAANHLAISRIALIVGTQPNDRVPRCVFPNVIVPMKPIERRKRLDRCDEE
jgi:hypothetical protein